MHSVLLLALGIGFVAGLRSMTAPAMVSWAAHLQWIHLQGTPLAFMASPIAVGIFTLAALGELVADKLPKTPARTAAGPLIGRIVMGALCGACLYAAAAATPLTGAVIGAVGAVIGTFAGYHIRHALVTRLGVKDVIVAVTEDIVAIALAYGIVTSVISR